MYKLLLKNIKLILLWGLLIALLAAIVTLLLPKQYSAESLVLIISRDRTGVDPYTQAKSAERIGENLAQVINTTDFYNKVMKSSYNFDKNSWTKLTERKQRKKWAKDVQVSVTFGTGLVAIKTYSKDKTDAVNLANAVAQVVANEGWEYVSGNVVIKQVTTPLAPRFPARPNFILNIVAGLLVGWCLATLWVVNYKKHHLFG